MRMKNLMHVSLQNLKTKINRTLFFFPGFLVFAAEGIGTAEIESETMALIRLQTNKRFAKTLICEEGRADRKF